MKVLIIGNHAAGLSAAETLRDKDPSCEITIVSREDVPPYSRCLIPEVLSGEKTGREILFKPPDFYEAYAIKRIFGISAEKILPNEKCVLLSDGRKEAYDNLIIATGGTPSMPRIPGIKNKGVFKLRSLGDAEKMNEYCAASKVKAAVVLGGGLVGLKAAFALHEKGCRVTVAVGSPHVLSQTASEFEAVLFEKRLAEAGIEIMTSLHPAGILGNGTVSGVEMTDGTRLECQLVVAAKGVTANKRLVEGSGIETEYGIIVDEHCRTNVENIYAAGDVTQSPDSVRGENWMNALWPHAVEEGRVAAENILGMDTSLRPRTSMNSLRLGSLSLITCGLTGAREIPEGAEEITREETASGRRMRFIFKGDRLIGYSLAGRVADAGVLTALVTRGIPLGAFKERIISGRFDFAALLPLILEHEAEFSTPEYREVLASFRQRLENRA